MSRREAAEQMRETVREQLAGARNAREAAEAELMLSVVVVVVVVALAVFVPMLFAM